MTRRTIFSALVAIFVTTLAMIVAPGSSASAQQNPNCCTYTVDIAGIAPTCFPFRLTTVWNCGGVKTFDFKTYLANGVYVEPLNPPGAPPCPPACKFAGAGLNGPGGPFATFNNPVRFNVNGCCMVVRIGFDANGCVTIFIRPC
jgi:hypothetical protein